MWGIPVAQSLQTLLSLHLKSHTGPPPWPSDWEVCLIPVALAQPTWLTHWFLAQGHKEGAQATTSTNLPGASSPLRPA